MTGTQKRKVDKKEDEAAIPDVVAKPPPEESFFSKIRPEKAKLHTFNPKSGKWDTRCITVKMDNIPFARGALRLCYYCWLDESPVTGKPFKKDCGKEKHIFVAKLSIDPLEERATYFTDVQVQMYSRMIAEKFNAYDPPKKIEFLRAWLLELVERPSSPMYGLEKFIFGPYRKHNNNCKTQQNFIHFINTIIF